MELSLGAALALHDKDDQAKRPSRWLLGINAWHSWCHDLCLCQQACSVWHCEGTLAILMGVQSAVLYTDTSSGFFECCTMQKVMSSTAFVWDKWICAPPDLISIISCDRLYVA